MSDYFMAHLIMDNEIDATFADRKFNWRIADGVLASSKRTPIPVFNGNIFPLGDNYIYSCWVNRGPLRINGDGNGDKFWFSLINGENLFRRYKYAFYDQDKRLYLARNGNTIENNNLLIVPRDDGRGVKTTEDSWFIIKGEYKIIN